MLGYEGCCETDHLVRLLRHNRFASADSLSGELAGVQLYIAWRDQLLSEETLEACLSAKARCESEPARDRFSLRNILDFDSELAAKIPPSVLDEIEARSASHLEAINALTREPNPQNATPLETSDGSTSPLQTARPIEDEDALATNLEDFPTSSEGAGGASIADTPQRPSIQGDARYTKSDPHAEGGLGKVWIALDRELQRNVALKEIQPQHADDPSCRLRFLQEAEITGALEHPGIVPVYGMGCYEDGRPFYAMRFIEGKTLKSAIDSLFNDAPSSPYRDGKWRLKFRQVLGRFVDVCNTIEYAHSKNVIHRDIKPSNIMLGEYGETLVVDWGLAKLLGTEDSSSAGQDTSDGQIKSETPSKPGVLSGSSEPLSVLGSAIGTPAYMSAEQASGGTLAQIGPASDVYSLGASLFHLLTGSPPVADSSMDVRPSAIHAASQLTASDRQADLPTPLSSICKKAMALMPENRYASARELANDLESWLADEPVAAHEENRTERISRWVRTHPKTMVGATVGIVLLTLSSVAGVIVRNKYVNDVKQAEIEKQQESDARLQQVRSVVQTAEASALAELGNSRFEAALEFLDTAYEQLQSVPELAEENQTLSKRLERTRQLVDFYRLLNEAEEATFGISSRRSTILFQTALRRLGVFEQLEWWTNLPTDDLTPQQQASLREDIYQAIYLLVALRLKETVPENYDARAFLALTAGSEESQASVGVLFDLMDAYRSSQGSVLGRDFSENRTKWLQRVAQGLLFQREAIEWKPKNVADLYIMGSALAYFCMGTQPDERGSFQTILGITDAEETAEKFLLQAAELRPSHFYTLMMQAAIEEEIEEYEDGFRSYQHAIALKPSSTFAHYWRGYLQFEHAMYKKDENGRPEPVLLQRAIRDIERAIDADPTYFQALIAYANYTSWIMLDVFEVVPLYERALNFAEPYDSIRDAGIESEHKFSLKSISDWLRSVYEAGTSSPRLLGGLAFSEYLREEYEAAEKAAVDAIKSNADEPYAQLTLAHLRLRQEELTEAETHAAKALLGREDWFHAAYVLGLVQSQAGKLDSASKNARLAFDNAIGRWQKLGAKQLQCRIAVLQNAEQNALKFFDEACAIDPAEDFESLSAFASKRTGTQTLIAAITDRQNDISPIVELDSDIPVTQPAFFNGDFELGLVKYWGDTLEQIDEPGWKRVNGSRATAVVDTESHSGLLALKISDSGEQAEDRFAILKQKFPVAKGKTYRLRFNATSRDSEPNGLEVSLGESKFYLPEGTYPWREFEIEHVAQSNEASVQIKSYGKVDASLDNMSVQLVATHASQSSDSDQTTNESN